LPPQWGGTEVLRRKQLADSNWQLARVAQMTAVPKSSPGADCQMQMLLSGSLDLKIRIESDSD
jgi:hypothetical protein